MVTHKPLIQSIDKPPSHWIQAVLYMYIATDSKYIKILKYKKDMKKVLCRVSNHHTNLNSTTLTARLSASDLSLAQNISMM